MRVAARLLIWLLAVLTPLQGMAAAVVVTRGPAHFARSTTTTDRAWRASRSPASKTSGRAAPHPHHIERCVLAS